MRSLAAYSGRAGPSYSSPQPSRGIFRRPTAVPLRLFKLQTPFTGVTHLCSAATQSQEELDALEQAHRASKQQNGSSAPKKPADVLKDAELLKLQFEQVQKEVVKYRGLSADNAKLQVEIERLNKANEELQSKLASQQEELAQAVESARAEAVAPLQQQLAELSGQVAAQQEELQRAVEAARQETAEPLRQQLAALASQVEVHDEELRGAMDAARAEVAGPLQQQLEELSMQLQNSQAQLDRLGEEVETAETEKAAAIQAMRDENQQLMLALEGATRRLADVVYPPGTLPPGLTVSTRLEGNIDLEALAAQQQQQQQQQEQQGAAVASASASPEVAPGGSGQSEQPAPTTTAAAVQQPQERVVVRGPTGFLGWLFGVFRFWLYQVVGALLLYYAASILRGAPPVLNDAFFVGCVVVCTLLSWTNNLLFPRFAA